MSNQDEQFIDAMVEKTLFDLVEWGEIAGEGDVELNTENVHQAAIGLNFPLSKEQVAAALQRRLVKALFTFFRDEIDLEEDQRIQPKLQYVLVGHVLEPINLQQIDWGSLAYETLYAVYKIIWEVTSMDLLLEFG